jgi:hypothetical protein
VWIDSVYALVLVIALVGMDWHGLDNEGMEMKGMEGR